MKTVALLTSSIALIIMIDGCKKEDDSTEESLDSHPQAKAASDTVSAELPRAPTAQKPKAQTPDKQTSYQPSEKERQLLTAI